MRLDPSVFWPVFPLLLLVVVVCLTWALVHVVRQARGTTAIWLQAVALASYLLAAAAAIASERDAVSVNLHRPFSIFTQLVIVLVLFHVWKKDRSLTALNGAAWAAILADTALHYICL
ncbi:MAG: hypothetical protein ACE5NA_04380 [Nitrospiraceae bacterium]